MTMKDFEGWRHYTVLLPEGQRLVCFYFQNGAGEVSCYDENHNVFRLDKDGNVVWQVQRDELGKLNWDAMHEQARARGEEGAREPFADIVLIYADGAHNCSPQDGNPPEVAQWVPGCTVRLRSFSGPIYELDIETGIARNVTPYRMRPW